MGKIAIEFLPLKEYTGEEIKAMRNGFGYSRPAFAQFLGVSPKTIEAWEYGFKNPSGTALRLLQLIEKDAAILKDTFIVQG